MNTLVVNIGSTSFKFRLFDMDSQEVLAQGSVEGVGSAESKVRLKIGEAAAVSETCGIADQAEAVRVCTQAVLAGSCHGKPLAIDAIGFKAVHGGPTAEPTVVDDALLAVMERYADIVPAHNPAYIAAMKAFAKQMPDTPQVAAFETGFHQTVPAARSTYAIPYEWVTEHGVRRYGFHGASHRYIALQTAVVLERNDLKVISCHLGGSSSICAIDSGKSIANSFGMAPQSGIPHNNRVGDFDAYALPFVASRTGKSIEELLSEMSKNGGLLGISGLSNDMKKLTEAAAEGHERAKLAVDVFVDSVRHYIGAYLVALGGLDVLVFTGGIGERSPEIRRMVCEKLEFLGIKLDERLNAEPPAEGVISEYGTAVRVLALETNEELVVARQTQAALSGAKQNT